MGTPIDLREGTNGLKEGGRERARRASTSPLMEKWMRFGYMVRGLVYCVIGLFAFRVALGAGGALDDPQGAIVTLGNTPLGGVVLYGVLLGLVGYASWGLIRALFDPLREGTHAKGIIKRTGYAVSSLVYMLLAFATYRLIVGGTSAARNGAQAAQTQETTASILSKSWGPWIVGAAAIIVGGFGLSQVFLGLRRDFHRQFEVYSLSNNQRTWIDRLGRFGTAARGVVFALVGMFLFLAALHNDPSLARGMDGVLSALLHRPYGASLLGVVALGLVAFGMYSIMSGIWLRFKRTNGVRSGSPSSPRPPAASQ
jgi:hypothetical protein